MFVCVMYVCILAAYDLRNGWTIWLNVFLLALSWSWGGFRPKKNPDPGSGFRVLFNQFGWNFQVILTWTQICFNTIKFLDRVSGFPNPKSVFSGKIRQNLAIIRFNSIPRCDIFHFSYSNNGKYIFDTNCAIWKIFSKFLKDFSR